MEKLKTRRFIIYVSIASLVLIFLVTISCFRYHQIVMVFIIVLIITQCGIAIWYSVYSSYKDKKRESQEDLSLRQIVKYIKPEIHYTRLIYYDVTAIKVILFILVLIFILFWLHSPIFNYYSFFFSSSFFLGGGLKILFGGTTNFHLFWLK